MSLILLHKRSICLTSGNEHNLYKWDIEIQLYVALIAQSPGQHSCSSSAQQFEFCKCCKVWQGLHWRRSSGGHWTWRKPVAMQCELATSSINISIVFPPGSLCCSRTARVWTMLSQTGNRFCSGNVLIWESSISMLRLWNNLLFQMVAKKIRWCVAPIAS